MTIEISRNDGQIFQNEEYDQFGRRIISEDFVRKMYVTPINGARVYSGSKWFTVNELSEDVQKVGAEKINGFVICEQPYEWNPLTDQTPVYESDGFVFKLMKTKPDRFEPGEPEPG